MIPVTYTSDQKEHFSTLFGTDIENYWSPITGFDLIKFDDTVVNPADGESTAQKVEREWGIGGVALIRELIGRPSA